MSQEPSRTSILSDANPALLGALTIRYGSWTDLCDAALTVRRAVFQAEQGFERGVDEDAADAGSIHVVVEELSGATLGTCRLFGPQLGRLSVLPPARHKGVAYLMVSWMLRLALLSGEEAVWANAQAGALNLARVLGFEINPAPYELAGRRHYRIVKRLATTPSEVKGV